jgi:hypothetical protein
MARPPPKRSSRDGAGDTGAGRPQGRSAGRGRGLAKRGLATRGLAAVDGDDPDHCSDDDLEVENDDDLREDAVAFSIDLGATIDVDVEDADADDTPTKTGKNKSEVWKYFTEVKEGSIRVGAIYKHCGAKYSAISASGTDHLSRHENLYGEKESF